MSNDKFIRTYLGIYRYTFIFICLYVYTHMYIYKYVYKKQGVVVDSKKNDQILPGLEIDPSSNLKH